MVDTDGLSTRSSLSQTTEEQGVSSAFGPTVGQVFRARMTERASAAAIWVAPGQFRSFQQVNDLVAEIVDAIRGNVVAPYPRIAFATPRGAAGVYGFLAAIEIGTCCPLDSKLTEAEFVDALAALKPHALLTTDLGSAGAQAARAASITVVCFRLNAAQSDCEISCWRGRGAHVESKEFLLRGDELPAILMRTSGTTADPKIVGLSHNNVLAATIAMKSVFELAADDTCVTPMPLHHVHGLIAGALSALTVGSSIHCCETFSPQAFDLALQEFSPTWLTAAPALHLAMCDYYEGKPDVRRVKSLRRFRSSSAPLAPSSIRMLESMFDAPLLETYGLTETASTTCSNLLPPRKRKPGSVGVPINAELLILDDACHQTSPGVNGEILLRGPSVIQEYLGKKPEGAFWDGWLRTGDIGYVDEDGYLYLVGRKKEVIKRGGHSVFPLEVDNALNAHPAVAEALTFAIPHATLGEDVLAAVVAKPAASVDPTVVRAHIADTLSSYKIPTRVLVVDNLPRNAIGKALRREMPKLLAAKLAPEALGASSPTEKEILAVWHKVLRRSDIGVTDNVFEFGGDPLRAELAAGLITETVGVKMAVKLFYAKPTVREQAEHCLAQKGQR